MQIVAFSACFFLVLSILGLIRARRLQADDLRIDSLELDATTTTIAGAPADGRIQITGRVGPLSGESLTAPFTGEEVVWARSEMQDGAGRVLDGWTRAVSEIAVADDSGQVAHVKLRGAKMHFSPNSVPTDLAARYFQPFLEARGVDQRSRSGASPYQAVLRPGDTVSIIATSHRSEAGYREDGGGTLTLSADDGELVLFSPDEQAQRPAIDRMYVGFATFAIVVSAIAVIVSFIVLFG